MRTTVQFFEDGTKRVVEEDWRTTTHASSATDRLWRGYSFFRIVADETATSTNQDTGGHHGRPEDPVSDGGFEFLRP